MSDDPISPEDKEIFRQAMRSVNPLRKNNKHYAKQPLPKPIPRSDAKAKIDPAYTNTYLSDFIENPVAAETQLSYQAHSIPKKRFQDLSRGLIPWEAKLDLHGTNSDGARQKLIHFIKHACSQQKRCLLIVHGKGGLGQEAPRIKNLVNHWLKQMPEVLAFHSAVARDGGNGAVYVLLKRTALP